MEVDRFNHIEEDSIDLKRILRLLYRYKLAIILITILITGVACLVRLKMKGSYNVTFVLYHQIDDVLLNDKSNVKSKDRTENEDVFWQDIMQSNKLHDLIIDYSGLNLSKAQVKNIFSVDSKETDMYNVSIKTADPSIINNLQQSFLKGINTIDRNLKLDFFSNKIKYLREQRKNTKESLDLTNEKIGTLTADFHSAQLESFEDVTKLNDEYNSLLDHAEVELAYIQASKQMIHKELTEVTDSFLQQSSFTEPLKVQLMNLYVNLAKAQTKYGSEHPEVLGILENIERVQDMVKSGKNQQPQVQNIVSNPAKIKLIGQNIELNIKEHSLQAKIESIKKLLNTSSLDPSTKSQLYRLLKEKQTLASSYDFLNKKIIDLEMNMYGISPGFLCIDPPIIPTDPSLFPFYFFILGGLAFGAGTGGALVILYDLTNNKIKLLSDFVEICDLPLIGMIPHAKSPLLENLTAENKDTQGLKNSFVRTSVNFRQLMNNTSENVVTVFSPVRSDGKTSILCNLSNELAKSGKKVLLIDFDIYIPKLSKTFREDHSEGLQDILMDGDKNIADLIKPTKIDNLHILPSGINRVGANIYLDSPQIDKLFNTLKLMYDYIFVDTPALIPKPQIYYLLKKASFNLLVVRIGNTKKGEVKAILEYVESLDTPCAAIATDVITDPFNEYYYKSYSKDYYNPHIETHTHTWRKKEKFPRA